MGPGANILLKGIKYTDKYLKPNSTQLQMYVLHSWMFLSVACFLMTVAYLALEHACSKDFIWDPCGNLVGGANNFAEGNKIYTRILV